MKGFSRAEIQAAEARAIRDHGCTAASLMEQAGKGAVDFLLTRIQDEQLLIQSVLVLAGKGNNGGDGLVAARYLQNQGFAVQVLLFGAALTLEEPVKSYFDQLVRMKVSILQVTEEIAVSNMTQLLQQADLIVDALFGIGLTRPLSGQWNRIIELINASQKPVLALDIPSGLDADEGPKWGGAVRARWTASMGCLKKSFLLPESRIFTGLIHVVDIGLPRNA